MWDHYGLILDIIQTLQYSVLYASAPFYTS